MRQLVNAPTMRPDAGLSPDLRVPHQKGRPKVSDARKLIQEVRELDAKAFPGPWRECGANSGDCKCGLIWETNVGQSVVCTTTVDAGDWQFNDDTKRANERFICRSRTLLVELADALEKALEARPALRLELEKLCGAELDYWKALEGEGDG